MSSSHPSTNRNDINTEEAPLTLNSENSTMVEPDVKVDIQQLPDLQVTSTQGEFNLTSLNGHYTLLYFYPKDLTPGCTTQAQDFRDLTAHFEQLNVKIYGVSRDPLKLHDKFTNKENIPFALISDVDETLCRQFDVIKLKNMYGKQVQGIERSTFLFDPNGQLIQCWRKVKAAGHAQTVLDYLHDRIRTDSH